MPETIRKTAEPSVAEAQPATSTDAQLFGGALSRTEWSLRGHRNRLFVLCAGSGQIRLSRRAQPISQPLTGPCLLWLPAGEQGVLTIEAGGDGGALAVPDPMLGAAMPTGTAYAPVRDAISRPVLGTRLTLTVARRLTATIGIIGEEAAAGNGLAGADEAIRHHLALVLIALWRVAAPLPAQPRPSPRIIVRSFVQLVDAHMREHWTVPDYAEALGVTADRLNTAVRRATGRTPVDFIHNRLAAEAAILLDGSPLQIAEIADALGFRDAAYFSRFFKRMAGLSPRAYREGLSQRRTLAETSYAAWP
ncbi:transcriptional regulator, AraC family [Rhizobium sp. RU35A]|uniref:Helix-turn-helix domain-containing protein n=1 Tax=Rhizobium straminoryzae TaxID=1387186 RepID=A0A549T5E2_9HYPH|nr:MULTISPECIES: helix-turn-helix domain-containing protein [Rhizobium]TRL37108.1 helix-turn-helix domain-containing protein [Rhizobium straminoryzae]SIQ71475.1 transcriptional regulator, AraC family [Rhizobium sp. RU35A]